MEENQLVAQVIDVIVDAVNLQHIDRSTLGPDTSLMQNGLGLDSVDILEVVVAIEHKYGVKVVDAASGKMNFQTIGSVVNFVKSKASH